MAAQGTLNFVSGDPARIVTAFREQGFTLDITGTPRNWRQLVVVCGEATLTLRLKTQESDPAYFRRHLPLLQGSVGSIPTRDRELKTKLIEVCGALRGSIGLTADPKFTANQRVIDAMRLAAGAVDGFFSMVDGFYDSDLLPLLLNNGASDPSARMPAISRPLVVEEHDGFGDDPVLPKPMRAAERLFIMLSVGYRAMLEDPATANADAELKQLAEWFWSLEVAEELESHERRAMDCQPGRMPKSLVERLMLSFESVVVLAWALHLADLPAHDEPVNAAQLCKTLGLFSEDARFVIDSAELRSPHELREAADRIMAVHWRLVQFDREAGPVNMNDLAAEAWFGDMDRGKLALIDNDLAIANKPVVESCEEVREQCRSITVERHRAINWLLGHHPLLSRVEPTT